MIMRVENERDVAPVNASAQGGALGPGGSKWPGPRTTRRVVTFLSVAALGGAALVSAGLAPRAGRGDALAADAKAVAEARRAVSVVTPTRDGSDYELRLPASTAPLQVTVLYARTNGYVKRFHADIGDRVKSGAV